MMYFIGFKKVGKKHHLSLVGPYNLFSILMVLLVGKSVRKIAHSFITHQRRLLRCSGVGITLGEGMSHLLK